MTIVVEVSGLNVVARADDGAEVRIVKDVGFTIAEGEVLALIGESGSGKTTTALALMGYARSGCRITGGRIRIGAIDVLSLPERELSAFAAARWATSRKARRLRSIRRRPSWTRSSRWR